MTDTPRVSVVMGAFNEPAATLAESFDSLIAQTFADFECLVVDDSTDEARRAACEALCARDRRFAYIHPPQRLGLAAGLNLAIARSRGELIARFDSDDICAPDRLARQLAFMDARPDIDLVGAALEMVDEAGAAWAVRPYPLDHAAIARRMQFTSAVAHPTVMIRRAALERWGAYDPSYRWAEDLELWLRLINRGARFANLPEPLVRYRQVATGRGEGHWRYNLRARLANFSWRLLPWRLAGLAAILGWGLIPQSLRGRIYGAMMLRSRAAR